MLHERRLSGRREEIEEDIEKEDTQAYTADDITTGPAQPVLKTMLDTLQLQRLGVDAVMPFTNC